MYGLILVFSFFCWASLQNSQLAKQTDEDNKGEMNVSYDQSLESSQQARVTQSLQAHDYVRMSLYSTSQVC